MCEFRGTAASQQLAQQLASTGLIYQQTTVSQNKLAANALLLASKYPLKPILWPQQPTEPRRWLLSQVEMALPVTIGVMHVPNRVTGRKYDYHDAVLALAAEWPWKAGLLVGDTNTGMPGLDEETKVFSQREAAWITGLAELGWVDVFRYLQGDKRVYTWYSPNGGNGFRLDQAFANRTCMSRIKHIQYVWGQPQGQVVERRDVLSDHAAILLDFD